MYFLMISLHFCFVGLLITDFPFKKSFNDTSIRLIAKLNVDFLEYEGLVSFLMDNVFEISL